jgi:hypothetical protein
MTFPKARLAVSAVLFVGWLGFLFYLVVDSPSVILSRPQFLQAQLFVVAQIGGGQGDKAEQIVIKEILWTSDLAGDAKLVDQQVSIPGVAECVREDGYEGPGLYLLPLVKMANGSFRIAPLPTMAQTPAIRIYPWTPRLREQVEAIVQSRK